MYRIRSARPSLGRLTALVGGTLLGAAVALTIAAPASAHHSVVSGEAQCDSSTGEWVVTWTVDTVAPKGVNHYKLVKVDLQPVGSTVSTIVQTNDDSYPHTVGQPLVGEQRLPGTATSASLAVQAKWENGFEEKKPVSGPPLTFGGPCQQDKPKPNASFASACDGSVTVTLTNAEDAKVAADFTVTGEGGFSKKTMVKPGGSEQVTVPAKAAGEVTVIVGDQKFEGGFTQPEDCAPVSVAARSDCDSLTVSIENPEGTTPVEATLTPNSGEAKKVTVAPGETKEVAFAGEEGTVVTLSIGGESEEIAWEQPEDCGGSGGGSSLPVTGASIGGAIGVAAGLLALGTVLFFVFRRRRIRFTA